LAAFILLCFSTAPSGALFRWVTEDSWPYVYSIWGAGLLGVGLFALDVIGRAIAEPLSRSRSLLVAMAPPVAFLVWVALSAWWSVSPTGTPPQVVVLVMVTITAVWFGHALPFRQQVWSTFIALQVLTALSFVTALLLPSARYFRDDSWMGVFGNPNTTGPVATLGVVVAIAAVWLTAERRLRGVIAMCVALDLVVAVRSLSITGWLALGGAVAALLVVRFSGRARQPRQRRRIRVVVTTLVAVAIVSIPWSIEFAVGLVSDEATFTGRTLIWDFVRESVADRPLLGFGWASFWDDPSNLAPLLARAQRERPEWVDDLAVINSAHSSFMETLLLLGAVGLVLVLVLVAFSVGRTWSEALGIPSPAMAWWTAVATFALVVNVTESMIAFNPLFWLLLVAPGFAATRHAVR